jgi:phosphatidylethanolamine/phosphatidyl-N-methylethanolamine N-methyltransferase
MRSVEATILTNHSYIQSKIALISNNYEVLKENVKDYLHFLIEFIKEPSCNGSIIPSSKQLTEKIIRYIPNKDLVQTDGQYYMEVGPGTGPFTKAIVERLRPQDILDVIELNPSYCESLRKKFPQENVHIHCISITDWKPEYSYDVIISGLPLNGFSPELVQKCFNVFERVIKNNGNLAYFDYPNLAKICLKFYSNRKRQELQEILAIKDLYFKKYGTGKITVTDNFPTATVSYLKIEKNNENNKTTPFISSLPNPIRCSS